MKGVTERTARSSTPQDRPIQVPWLIAGGVLVGALMLRWTTSTHWNFNDLTVFVRGGEAVLRGDNLYPAHPGQYMFTYPPFAGGLFVLLALMGMTISKVVFSVGSLVAYFLAVAAAGRSAPMSGRVLTYVALAGLALEPMLRVMVLGQIDVYLMALVLCDLFLLPSQWRGTLIGIAAGIKLMPAFLLVYYALQRDWASVLRGAATFAGTVAVGCALAPASSVTYWSGAVFQLSRFGYDIVTPQNQSMRAFIARLLGEANPPGLMVGVVIAIVAAMTVAAAWRQMSYGDCLAAALCLAAGMLLVSPVSWTHGWIWAVPALLVLLARGRILLTWIVASIFFFAPIWLVPFGGGRDLSLNLPQGLLSGLYAMSAVALSSAMLVDAPPKDPLSTVAADD